MKNITVCCLLIFSILMACATNTDKTLVSWVELNDLSVMGGSILTIQSSEQFDGIVFGETEAGKWIAGSEYWNRTDKDTKGSVEQTGKLIQMAIVYEGNNIRIYRNGILYSAYEADNIDLLNDDQNFVLFGLRHRGVEAFISAEIEDARIYGTALTLEQINSLKPDEPSDIEPYAWWDFEGEEPSEKTGRYLLNMIGQADDAELKNGRLVLREWGSLIAIKEYVEETPQWPDNPPDDWLTFHLVHPGPGRAEPGDPNPVYFYNGLYHLHYIYLNQYGFAYAHVSSTDMVHWKWHPT
ncbi:MAG: LamG-like jellyroll fold domain-containing protein, partial [Ignavibacteriaceae bacterium]